MLVLSKKRLSLIIGCVFVAIFSFMVSKENKIGEAVQVVSLPVSGKTVIVDAGHGMPDGGAESSSRNNRSRN